MATYLDAAGPTGAPAVVIHPDQELPKIWRVLSTWEQDGTRGAWLERTEEHRGVKDVAQVVYGDERIFRPGNLGNHLVGAALQLGRPSFVANDHWSRTPGDDDPDRLARVAYYAEQGQDIARLDWYARKLYEANGKPGPDDPFDGTPTPSIDKVPDPAPTDSEQIVKAVALKVAMHPARMHPDSEWPDEWQRRTHGGTEWAYQSPATWVPVEQAADAPVRNVRGMRMQLTNWRHRQSHRIWEAERGTTAAPAPKAAPAPSQRPSGPPPEPGVDRAKWIGERITAMTAGESSGYLPHTRRRIAAHRALSIVAGYTPADAVNDGLTLPGGLLLHLEGLNAYAARAFAGQED